MDLLNTVDKPHSFNKVMRTSH